LAIIEEVDFSRILPKRARRDGQTFNVSACGRFVLFISLGDIFVYTLCAPERPLALVIRLAAGIEVLKVSMDTISERYSVAALLAGRTGMLWDLPSGPVKTQYRNSSGETISLGMQTDVQSSATLQASTPLALNLPLPSQEFGMPNTLEDDISPPRTVASGDSSPGFVPSPPSL
jgi:hypothetical protein